MHASASSRACSALRGGADGGFGLFDLLARDRSDDLGTIEQASLLLGRQPVLDVLVLEDLVERAAAVVLANHVACDVVFGGALLEQEREEILEYGHVTRLYPGG